MEPCPCGSEKEYAECCQPLIKGERSADTAEALMRSRYTAYALQDIDYLESTLHGAELRDFDKDATARRQAIRRQVWKRNPAITRACRQACGLTFSVTVRTGRA